MSGVSTVEAVRRARANARQVNHWLRHGAIAPSIHRGHGSGDHHRWSDGDVARLAALAAVRRDLSQLGAVLQLDGVTRIWDALEDRHAAARVGTVVIDIGLADDSRIVNDLAEAAS